jgi:anti-sigma regulatory factor (Ser/Thr protein kinase)
MIRDWISRVVAAHPGPADPADAALVVSELFANAVIHGPPSGQVLVGYVLWSHGARIVVSDGGGATMPRLRDSTGLEEGGRGLYVVDALSAQWGSFRTPRAQVVWCDLGQPMHAAAGEAWA